MMNTTIHINDVPGKDGTFNTVAVLSKGKQYKDHTAMGFKVHIPSIVFDGKLDTGEYVMDAIKEYGWKTISYQHILCDEAFVQILHKCGEPMIIRGKM